MPPHGQAVIRGGVHQELRDVHHLGRHPCLPPVGADRHSADTDKMVATTFTTGVVSNLRELYPI
jgi:hypothetical protein